MMVISLSPTIITWTGDYFKLPFFLFFFMQMFKHVKENGVVNFCQSSSLIINFGPFSFQFFLPYFSIKSSLQMK